ncbi:TPA: tripartite tricarboxylate transporter permease [archaeon]|nr:tripartite tricarboxylate transporter permease [Candidatus Undinarchaeales archaeon SRR5007147.bin71]
MFEILLFVILGCFLGTLTGLVPGIHTNTLAAIIVGLAPVLSKFDPLSIAALLMSMGVVHTFLDFIPSILLGIPEGESALSVLPGHSLLMEGRGIEAIRLTAFGSLSALLITLILFLPALLVISAVYPFIQGNILWILSAVVVLSILSERRVFMATVIFLISGVFGYFTLNGVEGLIFPALSGMFGISTMLISLKSMASPPEQENCRTKLKRGVIASSLLGAIAGILVGILPGIGAAQATFVVQNVRNTGREDFLVSVSGVNTANIIFTLVVMHTVGKMRSGLVIAIKDIFPEIALGDIFVLLGVILFSGIVAYFLQVKIGEFAAMHLGKISSSSYRKLTGGVILLVIILVFMMTGFRGLIILLLGTIIGLFPPKIGVRRAQCMGFFMIPVLLFYSNL